MVERRGSVYTEVLERRMMKRIVTLLGIGFLLFHFLFLWMYTNIDGYFYWAIGEYFKTGVYPFIAPFIYNKPTTISPPLYGLFLAIISIIPRGDILLHLLQIIMMATTTILLYRILVSWIAQGQAVLVAFLFLVFPANVIFTGSMMTEIPAQTAMTIYLYLTQKFLKTRNTSIVGHMLILAAFMTLLKYQFLVLFLWSLLLARKLSLLFPMALGMLIIGFWVLTNHRVTGVWGLSDTKKMPFYTNFVWDGKRYPPENDPSVIAIRRYVPITADKYAEYWDLQDYILPQVNRNWSVLDELLGNVGIAAIRAYPLEYAINGMRVFIKTHGHRAPWWNNLQTYGTQNHVQPLYCSTLRSIRFCKPLIMTLYSFPLWNAYVGYSRQFYNVFIAPTLMFVFLPLLLLILALPKWNKRIYAVIYLVNLLPISYLAMVESRYLIPYYPLIIIIAVLGIHAIALFLRRVGHLPGGLA